MPRVEMVLGLAQAVLGPIHRLAIMGLQQREADRFAWPLLAQVVDGDEVAERFRHLLAFHLEEPVVHPGARHEWRMEGAARLRNLVLVMRKNEIDAAAVDVEGLAQMFPRHGRALDVPSRPTRRYNSGRRRPGRLAS